MYGKKIRLKCKFIGFKNNGLRYKLKECRNECANSTNEAVKNFPILYRFCNGDLDHFFWLSGKGAYHYEYLDSWEKFDETSISLKDTCYSELNEEGIRDADYARTQLVWKVFETTNLDEYHVCITNSASNFFFSHLWHINIC